MNYKLLKVLSVFFALVIIGGCKSSEDQKDEEKYKIPLSEIQNKVESFAKVELQKDISHLSDDQKKMLTYLFDAAKIMDDIFWTQVYGDKEELLSKYDKKAVKEYIKINYGPWEALHNNKSFSKGYDKRPEGARFYPEDMTKEEFKQFDAEDKASLYTLVKRDENGELYTVPYHEAYEEQVKEASDLLKKAAELAEDGGFKKYLELRAEALLDDEYRESDFAWLDMTDNDIDFIVGPIETYQDQLFGNKAAHESFILIKDKEWSKKLSKYTSLLPKLQKMLPVEKKYKNETPGSSGNQLNVYDAVYYAGDCNYGSKTIAINLPNDPVVRENSGSRKLQLKNSMKAKFDNILVPIAEELITESQRKNVTFDAFFANTMFHEVGHGLGLSYLVDDKETTVRGALKNYYTSIEESKADILGLFIVDQLYEMGELGDVDLMDYYVTFFTSIFRSSRFGVASAHGKANMMRFYYLKEKGAFTRDPETGTYKVHFEKMRKAMKSLAEKILKIQGDGDFEKAKAWVEEDGKIKENLQKDLDRVNEAGIPRDIRFKQGKSVLGLE